MRSYTFPDDPITYVVPTLIDMDRFGFELAAQVLAAGLPHERTVAIANGALPYALAVHNHLGGQGKIITLGMSYYDFDQVQERVAVVQDFPTTSPGDTCSSSTKSWIVAGRCRLLAIGSARPGRHPS